jgi:hypothetical protein
VTDGSAVSTLRNQLAKVVEGGNWVADDALLPGEDPVNIQNGDVEHWISVYQELLTGNRRLLQQMQNQVDARMDAEPLGGHIQRLEARLAFWEGRRP